MHQIENYLVILRVRDLLIHLSPGRDARSPTGDQPENDIENGSPLQIPP